MKRWLYLDFDEVISTYRYAIAIGEIGGLRCSVDPTALKLIEQAMDDHEVHLVISSAWRYTHSRGDFTFFAKLFRMHGAMKLFKALDRTVFLDGGEQSEAWRTGATARRTIEVEEHMRRYVKDGDIVVILDDELVETELTTGYVRVTSPYDGVSFLNYVEMRDIFDADVSNVNLSV